MLKNLRNILILTALIFALPLNLQAAESNKIESSFDDDFNDEEFEFYESDNSVKIHDPLENMNRKIYVFNDFLDRYFLEYAAISYRKAVPSTIRSGIHNFLNNLTLPISSFNSLLQGKVDNSLATFSNFLINSTVGIGGIFNIAGDKNIRYTQEDFGQTLGHYGIGSGTYLMIPFLGPSSTRDFSGFMVDKAINPLELNLVEIGKTNNLIDDEVLLAISGASIIDTRESLIDIIKSVRIESFDPYATIRSAYLQKRHSDIQF